MSKELKDQAHIIKQLKLHATELPRMAKISREIIKQTIMAEKKINKLLQRLEKNNAVLQAMQNESLQTNMGIDIVKNLVFQLPILYRSNIDPVRKRPLK